MIIYGIKNCDKVRAALKQAQADGLSAHLHDFRLDGIDLDLVQAMLADIEMSKLLNKRSTTWKQLDDATRANINAETLVEHPTLIKRPVVFENNQYRIGL